MSSSMIEHAVVIAGGGPTGLMLAAELHLGGVDVAVVERRTTEALPGSHAGGLHARTIEVLDQRGVAERFLSQGTVYPAAVHFHIPLVISDFPTRYPYTLGLRQSRTERILAAWVEELGVQIYRGRDVTGFTQDDSGVDVTASDGSTLRAQYLVGCDGGRSVVRRTAGIEFAGWDATTSWLLTEAQMREEPPWGFRHDATGIHAIGKTDAGGVGLALTDPVLKSGQPTLEEVRETLIGVYGTDFGVHSPTWLTRFNDAARQAVSYRDRRVLLAGDAAHIHPPLGGQGLNIGVQDAVNLGWKLAQVVKRSSSDTLLDTYHAERHPVAARVLKNTMAHIAIRRTDDRTRALADYVDDFLRMDGPRKRMGAEMSGLGVHYDLGSGHPLLGRRMPDLDIVTTDGERRVFTLLHDARPVLLDFGGPASVDITPWSNRVRTVHATYEGTWELPEIGVVAAPTAVLVRPDGYVAWVGDGAQAGLVDSLTMWFGPAAV